MAASTSKSKKKSEKGSPAEPITGLESIYKREPSLRTTLQQIEKQFGEGSIMPLGGEAQLKIEGVTVVDQIETYDYGKFVHIMDIEGNKVQLWEPTDH